MLMLAAILAMFVYGLIAATLGTILPDLSERFHLTPSQNGSIAFSQALGLILASLAVGPLLDAEGKKIGLVIGLALIALALSALPRSRGYRGILLLFFLMGVGGGIVTTGANALASDLGGAHRASILNVVNLFFGLGGFLTPFIAANIFKKKWMRLCYAIAAISVITLIVEVATRMPGPTGAHSFVMGDLGHVLGRPTILLLDFILFLYVSCEVGVWNWLPRHLIAQGIPESRALNILSMGFALGLLAGRFFASSILLHVSAINVVLGASILMAITTFLMLRTRSTGLAIVLVGIAGLTMAPVFPTVLAIVGNVSPLMSGTAIGFAITSGWIGLAVSSRIIGGIAGGDSLRLRKALLVIPAFAVLMIVCSLIVRASLHG